MSKEKRELSPSRREVIERIREYEKIGGEAFFYDVENDPAGRTLTVDDVDYGYTRFSSKVKAKIAALLEWAVAPFIRRSHKMTVVGKENLKGIKGGAIITANHFNRFESVAIKMVSKKIKGRHRFWRVIREGNFFIPGLFGFVLKNDYTLPISSSAKTMAHLGQAIDKILAKGGHVLIYPEQAMWYNYRKPRQYRMGAFYYAAKNKVPVISCFNEISVMDGYDSDGFPRVKYTVHVMPPIYPDEALSARENAEIMLNKSLEMSRKKYEEVYGEALTFGEGSPFAYADIDV